jgi:hypothetical protein
MNKVLQITGLALLIAQVIGIPLLTQQAFAESPNAAQPIVVPSPSAPKDQGDDPDMEGREGVPPNSVGSGTR